MINNIKIKEQKQSHHQELIWTPPSHDIHFVKHVTNIEFIGINIDLNMGVSYKYDIGKESLLPYIISYNIVYLTVDTLCIHLQVKP